MQTNLQWQKADQWLLEDGRRYEETFGSKGMFTILIVFMGFMGVSYVKAYQLLNWNLCSLFYVNDTAIQVSFFSKTKFCTHWVRNQSSWAAVEKEYMQHVSV